MIRALVLFAVLLAIAALIVTRRKPEPYVGRWREDDDGVQGWDAYTCATARDTYPLMTIHGHRP